MATEQRIDLLKKVYSKTQYPRIIDTQFNQLGVMSVNEQLATTITVTQFFEYYNELFYEIPAFGDTNSHEYLVVTSGEYINFDGNNAEIEALQNEIAQLRKDLLQAQIDKAEALVGRPLGINVDNVDVTDISGNSEYSNILKEVNSNPAVNTTDTTVVGNNPSNPTSQAIG
jgi:hypothetical protein